MKKIVMVIAESNFRDEELFLPKKALEAKGALVEIASSSLSIANGAKGGRVKPDLLYSNIDPSGYDCIIFVGGAGVVRYWDDPIAHRLAREAFQGKLILAAICSASVILARAGLLKGKKATVWFEDADELRSGGAEYIARDVVIDGSIITAGGPFAAKEFGEQVAASLGL